MKRSNALGRVRKRRRICTPFVYGLFVIQQIFHEQTGQQRKQHVEWNHKTDVIHSIKNISVINIFKITSVPASPANAPTRHNPTRQEKRSRRENSFFIFFFIIIARKRLVSYFLSHKNISFLNILHSRDSQLVHDGFLWPLF